MIIIIFSVALAVYAIAYAMMRISGRSTPTPDIPYYCVREDYYRRACVVAGCRYVGIQEGGMFNLVLFNSPRTGSTLALKEDEFSATAVRERIKTHEAKWGMT